MPFRLFRIMRYRSRAPDHRAVKYAFFDEFFYRVLEPEPLLVIIDSESFEFKVHLFLFKMIVSFSDVYSVWRTAPPSTKRAQSSSYVTAFANFDLVFTNNEIYTLTCWKRPCFRWARLIFWPDRRAIVEEPGIYLSRLRLLSRLAPRRVWPTLWAV